MIVKIKSHKRAVFGKILEYMVNNKDRLFDKDKRSFALTYNLKGKTIDKWIQQYKENETHRLINRKDSVKLTHEILSWHKDDAKNITLKKMEEMAREYIRQRNPNGIYVAVPHFDKEHYHVHICASGVEYKSGKSLRLSRTDLQKLKIEIQNFQKEKFPELSKSVVEHGKKNKFTRQPDRQVVIEKEYRVKLRTGRESEKGNVTGILKTCYKKADSRETFFQMLKDCGIQPYERGGRISGIVSDGRKFRLNRLGFTEERLLDLDKTKIRGRELKEMRTAEEKQQRGRRLDDLQEEKEITPDERNDKTQIESRENEHDDENKDIQPNEEQDKNENDSRQESREEELNEIRDTDDGKSEEQEVER